MSRWQSKPGSFAWLLLGIVALVCLTTATLVPQPIAAIAFFVAAFCWFRSGSTAPSDAEPPGPTRLGLMVRLFRLTNDAAPSSFDGQL